MRTSDVEPDPGYTDGLRQPADGVGTMAHDAVLRNLEVLGEAAKNVPAKMRQMDGTVTRDTGLQGCATSYLAHEFFGIYADLASSVVAKEVQAMLPD